MVGGVEDPLDACVWVLSDVYRWTLAGGDLARRSGDMAALCDGLSALCPSRPETCWASPAHLRQPGSGSCWRAGAPQVAVLLGSGCVPRAP